MYAQYCMGKTPVSMATLNGRLDVLEALCHHGEPLNFFVMYWTLALSTVNVTRIKAVISFREIMVCLS